MDQFRWDWPTRLNRLRVQNHFRLEFTKDKFNVVLLGGVGLGKTHLATALVHNQATFFGMTRGVSDSQP